jgi:hypothetical protein
VLALRTGELWRIALLLLQWQHWTAQIKFRDSNDGSVSVNELHAWLGFEPSNKQYQNHVCCNDWCERRFEICCRNTANVWYLTL